MPLSSKGIYHDTQGHIFYYGFRKPTDPIDSTWLEFQSLSTTDHSLLSENKIEDLTWDGNQIVLNFIPLDRAKEEKIAAFKDEAQRQILDIAPEWKQRNMIARAVELMQLDQTTEPEFVSIQAIWDAIKDIRSTSDQLEVDVNAATTEAEVDAVVWTSS